MRRSSVAFAFFASALVVAACGLGVVGCRELDRFSTNGDHFEGTVVGADFVRSGIAEGTRMCLTLDGDHLEDGPGQLSTSDGLILGAPLRPSPQLFNDPLSNFTFGDGHIKNAIYSVHVSAPPPVDAGADAAPLTTAPPSSLGDVIVVLALLQSNDVEVRLLRGAPELGATGDAGAANGSIFAVFPLTRAPGTCSF